MPSLEATLRERYLPPKVEEDLFLCPNARDLKATRDARPDIRAEPWNTKLLGGAQAVVIGDFSQERTELPPVLASSPALTFLQVPRHLAAKLRDVHVRNLRGELRIHGEGVADLLDIGDVPGVTHLGGYKINPKFKGTSFPALRGVALWEKNRKHLQMLFAELPKLQSLFLPAYKEVLADVPGSIGFLQLLWGSIDSLEGVSRLSHLEWLMIDRVTKLTSLDGLQGHETLKKLDVTHCAALNNARAAAKCPSLRSLSFKYCKNLGKEMGDLRATIEARGGVLNIES